MSIYRPTEVRLSKGSGWNDPRVLVRFPGTGAGVAAKLNVQKRIIQNTIDQNRPKLQGQQAKLSIETDEVNNSTSFYIQPSCIADAQHLLKELQTIYDSLLAPTRI